MTGPRFSSIRARISLLVLVPLLALASLWVFLTGFTYGDAHQLLQSRDFQEKTVLPTQHFIDALQKERRLTMAELGGARPDLGVMRTQRQTTDDAAEKVREGARDEGLRGSILPLVVERLDSFVERIDTLRGVRQSVDQRVADRERVLRGYSDIIDAGFAVYNATTPGDGSITAHARTLASFGRAREFMAREDALLTGALAAGRITSAERGQFAQLVGAQRMLYADNAPNLPHDDHGRYERLAASPPFVQLRALEDQVIRGAEPPRAAVRKTRETGAQPAGAGTGQAAARAPHAPVIEPAIWRSLADTTNGRLFELENEILDDVADHGQHIAIGAFTRLGLAGGVGLLAIVLSALLAVRVSRRLLQECRTLAAGVVDFTRTRLPLMAEQVRAGAPVEPEAAAAAELDYRITEIRQIAESFDRAREAVLLAAEGEVAARRGISEVFVNLARRNQALLHRQLSLLDTMERRTEDPSELSDLFRLDHLATRMRRHAEGLVILAGKTAGRGWRRPVPLVDVVRGAVAEVEDYPRVRVQPLPRVSLLGSAVADVIHLLAEVVENATTFSPPQSPVRVSGHGVASGFAIEVEDRGLGMTEEALRRANERLARPPEFDPSDSAQLGLFVVARLAERQEITVTLRPSPYGGTTAIALIPSSLIVESAEPEPAAVRRATGPMQKLPSPAAALPAAAQPGRGESGGVVRLVAEAEPYRPEPARPAEEPAPAAPVRAATPPAPAPVEAPPEPAPPSREGELPRRRRQQHLAPQLKERVDAHLAAQGQAPPPAPEPAAPPAPPAPEPAGMPLAAPVPMDAPADETGRDAAGTVPTGDDPDDGAARSPESMRSMMSAMQRGWQRGRQDAADAEAAGNEGDQEDDAP
ncbi:sensor histidine kinase [Actinomadura citrea]|uniref:histidine kinase n=1 Tax=Actinomadura citrea TaxID=46158 RepID=A0A7Y9GB45_9ACTN|nr:nitrate- and nitrite sensing domain-containing protein [Actinomadura citrea]NYE11855.1 signal transduction histidine kinase [Actinomadura citrea]GGT90871.1 ATPase [Actinomadura citrea]